MIVRGNYWVLDDDNVPQPTDLMSWASWMEEADRTVEKTKFISTAGEVEVSTVFVGVDLNWGEGPPVLFETLIFEGPLDGKMWCYSTWDEAVAGHKAVVAELKAQYVPAAVGEQE